MERTGRPRRRPEAPSAPTTLHEITRRYYATALALARAMGLPLTETFMREHRESISCCFIEAGRAGVRLPAGVTLPPLSAGEHGAEAQAAQTNGQPVVTTINGAEPSAPAAVVTTHVTPVTEMPPTGADLPTSIPAGLQLPCAEALIVDLRPPQLSLLIGKVGLRAMADKTLAPLHVALLAERAKRFEQGRKQTPEANGHGA